jgi:hypothetical protein
MRFMLFFDDKRRGKNSQYIMGQLRPERQCADYGGMGNDVFRISREADALASTQELEAGRRTTLPYGDAIRTLQVDMIAFDNADQSIRAYEIKRGNGQSQE